MKFQCVIHRHFTFGFNRNSHISLFLCKHNIWVLNMKKKLSKISGTFKFNKLRNDKRVVVFAVCLLIATTLWFLNALNKDYSTTIAFPVKYVNPPKNQFLANQPPHKLDLKVDAHGFTLLRHKLGMSFTPIVLNLSNITRDIEKSEDGYNIYTNNLIRRISDQVSNEITITSIQPEILRIKLDSLMVKKVPVKENIELDLKPQFGLTEPVTLSPEQVEITGPAEVLDTIYMLYTEDKSFLKLDEEVVRLVNIIHPPNTTVRPQKVTLKIPVEKFTEKEIKIPVRIKNKPETANIKLFPSEVKVTVLVGLSEFENVKSSFFDVFVDFENTKSGQDDLDVTVQSSASYLKILRYSPESVEYLIETN